MYDVIIIGAGVSGAASARELSRYKVKACVLEREEDVCSGTSKANSAIVHAGYDAPDNSLMARLNVRGSQMMAAVAKELDVPFRQDGSLVICRNEDEISHLQDLYQKGLEHGVKDMQIINKEQVLAMEPNVTDEVVAALYAPTAGIICPFTLNLAFAENAYVNGVEFYFNTAVQSIKKTAGGFKLSTSQGVYHARCVINAAGVFADVIHKMVSNEPMHITPRRGDYFLLDKNAGNHVGRTIFALPGKYGKGVLVSPTIHGNLIVGPTAIDINDREGTNTTAKGLEEVLAKAGQNVRDLPMNQVITSFSGLRAHEDGHEFIIGEAKDCENFINCAGIESPGLSSSPAIGRMVAEIVKEKLALEENPDFVGTRQGILKPEEFSIEERNRLIQENPAYGQIICRCEMISEGEIIDAIRRPLGARSLDGLKRRVRTGSGRCQGGFCTPRCMDILSREWGVDIETITKAGGKSFIVKGKNKGGSTYADI